MNKKSFFKKKRAFYAGFQMKMVLMEKLIEYGNLLVDNVDRELKEQGEIRSYCPLILKIYVSTLNRIG